MLKETSLTSYWKFKVDENDEGRRENWHLNAPADTEQIWVPSCWNELREELFHYEGVAWYFKPFVFDAMEDVTRYTLFFLGVNYQCTVWLNGQEAGGHTGGFTPFELDVTHLLKPGEKNMLAIRVDSTIHSMTSPPIGVDWFNYGGIFREVSIRGTADCWLDDVTVTTRMSGEVTVVTDLGGYSSEISTQLTLTVRDREEGTEVARVEAVADSRSQTLKFCIENARLWSPESPCLYDFSLTLNAGGKTADVWSHRIGIREFGIRDRKVLLNGKVIHLHGYSKHEEYPVTGRTFSYDILRRDYELCRQGNANFLRLCHYPHHIGEYGIASETGMLVIAEVPNVNFKKEQFSSPELRELANQQMRETIRYYKNETCIMFWSLFIECKTYEDAAVDFVPQYIRLAKTLDPTRFTVHASDIPTEDRTYEYFDVVGVNYWFGWYNGHTIEQGSQLMDKIAARYPDKPVLMTSGGWEGIYGNHSYKARMKWSEESQAEYLTALIDMYVTKDYIIGQIVWTFNDFRVSPWVIDGNARWPARPMGINHKGVMDLWRRPKLAYYKLQEDFLKWDRKN